MLLPLIGVLLIGAGLIALCASNWENMGDTLRLVIAFVPITILNIALYKNKDSKSEVLVQCLTFGVGFAMLFGFGIVTNVFQTPVDTDILIHLALFCVIPLIYVFDAYWLGVISIAAGISSSSIDYVIISLIGLFSMLPYLYNKIKQNDSVNTMLILHMGVLYRAVYLICREDEACIIVIALALAITMFLENRLFKTIVTTMIYIMGFVLSFINLDFYISGTIFNIIMLIYVLLIFFIIFYTYNYINNEDKILNYNLAGILSIVIITIMQIPTTEIASFLMVYILLYNAYKKFKEKDIKGYNGYSFVFTGFILGKMGSYNLHFMTQGIFFIVLGIVFIVLSKYVSNTIKQEITVEEVLENEELERE